MHSNRPPNRLFAQGGYSRWRVLLRRFTLKWGTADMSVLMSERLENNSNEQGRMRGGRIALFSVGLLATIGALWFGFMSCGGYGWVENIFIAALLTFACFAVYASSSALNSIPKKLAFLLGVPILYFVVSSAGNALYRQGWSGAHELVASWFWVIIHGRC